MVGVKRGPPIPSGDFSFLFAVSSPLPSGWGCGMEAHAAGEGPMWPWGRALGSGPVPSSTDSLVPPEPWFPHLPNAVVVVMAALFTGVWCQVLRGWCVEALGQVSP